MPVAHRHRGPSYTDKTMTNLVGGTYGDGTIIYENNIWNVEDVDNSHGEGSCRPFSRTWAARLSWVIDSDKNIVRAAYILSTLDGAYATNAKHYCSAYRELPILREPGADPV